MVQNNFVSKHDNHECYVSEHCSNNDFDFQYCQTQPLNLGIIGMLSHKKSKCYFKQWKYNILLCTSV